jgi:hypothetical protein
MLDITERVNELSKGADIHFLTAVSGYKIWIMNTINILENN